MINFKSVLPFWIVLILNLCALLVLGWSFGPTTGFGLITTWGSVWLVVCAIFSIINLLLIALMLIISIWGILATGKGGELSIGKWNMQSIAEFLMFAFACSSILVFIFSSASVGFVSFGSLLYIILVGGVITTYMILRQKGLIEKQIVLEKFSNFENKKIKKTKSKKQNKE